jgi:hypothetical protein
MKTNKNSGKHSRSPKGQRFEDDFPAGKGIKKDRSKKRRLSIYDDFDDDLQNFEDSLDFDSSDNPFDD